MYFRQESPEGNICISQTCEKGEKKDEEKTKGATK